MYKDFVSIVPPGGNIFKRDSDMVWRYNGYYFSVFWELKNIFYGYEVFGKIWELGGRHRFFQWNWSGVCPAVGSKRLEFIAGGTAQEYAGRSGD
jgi:hypothetical protein